LIELTILILDFYRARSLMNRRLLRVELQLFPERLFSLLESSVATGRDLGASLLRLLCRHGVDGVLMFHLDAAALGSGCAGKGRVEGWRLLDRMLEVCQSHVVILDSLKLGFVRQERGLALHVEAGTWEEVLAS
jgi:hypothetical protein